MWHYLWPHLIYHSTFLLLRRKKLLVVVFGLLGVMLVAPQVWVMNIYDFYVMYCPLPIYRLMLLSTLLSLFSLAFSVYFLTRDHLSRFERHVFHTFGLVDVVFETIFVYYTKRASVTTAGEMYIICYILSVCAVLSTAYFVCLLPLWMCWRGVSGRDEMQKGSRDCSESCRYCFQCIVTSPYIRPV